MGKKELLRKINSKYIDLGDKIQQLGDIWGKLAYMVTEIREATAIDIIDQIGDVCDSKMLTELESRMCEIEGTLSRVPTPDDPIYLDMQERVFNQVRLLNSLRRDLIQLGIGIKMQYSRLRKEGKNVLKDCIELIAGDNSIPLLQKHIAEALALVD